MLLQSNLLSQELSTSSRLIADLTSPKTTSQFNNNFNNNRCDQINYLIEATTISSMRESKPMAIESLKNMSQHPVENAWKLINFCDKKRCIFGAAPAEVVHCLQHGLFLYLFKCMFLQRKLNKSGRKRSLLITAKSNQKKENNWD